MNKMRMKRKVSKTGLLSAVSILAQGFFSLFCVVMISLMINL